MERTARLVVHIEEALRFAAEEDEPHLRLGLLLLDSAAELLLYRESEDKLGWQQYSRNYLDQIRRAEALGHQLTPEIQEMKARLEREVASEGMRRRIEREFDAKIDFLATQGLLAAPHARVLKKLHQYRNEAYHRDILRRDTLASAVRIYSHLVCQVLRDFPVHGFIYSSEPPAPLQKYLNGRQPSFDMHARIAAVLLDETGFGTTSDLAASLSANALDRLEGMLEPLSWTSNFLSESYADADWDEQATLHLCQLDDQVAFRIGSVSALHSLPKPAWNLGNIVEWQRRARELAQVTDEVEAFSRFADLEDDFEPTEVSILDLAMSVDRHIQSEIDRLRGK